MMGITAASESSLADSLRITPSVTVQEAYNTNTQGTGSGQQPDLVTQFAPGISISGDTARSNIVLSYSPSYNHYDLGTSPDRIDQNLNGTATITPFTNYLKIDFTTYAAETGASANSVNSQTGLLVPSSDRVLFYLGTVVPHFTENFSNAATLDAYYRLSSSNTSDERTPLPGVPKPPSLSNDSLSHDIQVIIGSAQSFGPLTAQLNFDYAFSTGGGLNNQSNSDYDFLGLQYHLNYLYAFTGSIGYQKIYYGPSAGVAAYTNEGMTWSIGVNITPNDTNLITLTYGLKEGVYVPTLLARYVLDQRTTIFASYIVAIENQQQSVLQNLQFLTHDQFGNAVDSRTGLPFVGVNSAFGAQNVLFRDKPFILTLSRQFQRSGASVSFSYETRNSLSGLPLMDEAWGGAISYSRELTPILQLAANIGYTDHRSSGAGANGEHDDLINASFSLTYTINNDTVATITENYYNRMSNIPANSSLTNQLLIGLRRGF